MTRPFTGKSQGFVSTQGAVLRAAVREVTPRLALRGVFCAVLVSAAALEAIRFGAVERPLALTAAYEDVDPVVAQVGDDVLRLSDAYAHAAFVAQDANIDADVQSLIASGTVEEAADHLALAQAARDVGLDGSLEVRAAMALAQRQILAEAFLEQVASDAVTEAAILARYEAKLAEAENDMIVRISKIVVATRDEAVELRERLPRTSFAELARQKSIDGETAQDGGLIGDVRAGDLDPDLADVVAGLPIGGISQPFRSDEGWVLVKLETKRSLRLPPLEAQREEIIAELREEAIAAALDAARDRAPKRIRTADAILREERAVAGRIAAARGL